MTLRAVVLAAGLVGGLVAGAQAQVLLQAPAPEVEHGNGAVLRGLDKVNGQTVDFEIGNGGFAEFGGLEVAVSDCRYPAGNPAGDAFAWVSIRSPGATAPLFEGWMIASSPALNALDHPRYDVWVIRCKT